MPLGLTTLGGFAGATRGIEDLLQEHAMKQAAVRASQIAEQKRVEDIRQFDAQQHTRDFTADTGRFSALSGDDLGRMGAATASRNADATGMNANTNAGELALKVRQYDSPEAVALRTVGVDQAKATLGNTQGMFGQQDKTAANAAQAAMDREIQQGKNSMAVQAAKPQGQDKAMTPNQQIAQTRQLRNDFVRETAAARTVEQQYSLMKSSLDAVKSGSAPAGSQGVLVTFQKILDPNSVVRESEYARSGSGQSLLNQLEGQWMRITSGGAGVKPEELEKFVQLSEQFVKSQARYAAHTKEQIDGIADEFGLNKNLITREIGRDEGLGASQQTGATGVTPGARPLTPTLRWNGTQFVPIGGGQ